MNDVVEIVLVLAVIITIVTWALATLAFLRIKHHSDRRNTRERRDI